MPESKVLAAAPGLVSQIGSRLRRTLERARGGLPNEDDWGLWHKACSGDAPSATTLVRQLTAPAHGLAMQLLRKTEDAQDVVQESFLRLWRSQPSDARGARLSTYFNTIVINRCKTLWTQRREFSTENHLLTALADQQQQQAEPQCAFLPPVNAAELQRGLGSLPPRQRMALAMWAYADAEVAEIARALEMEVNAAHQLLFRAKNALRAALQGAQP